MASFKLSLPKPATRNDPEPVTFPHPGHVARMGTGKGTCRDLVGEPERKRLLGRPRLVWEDNIKVDLQEVGWGKWTGLIWLRIQTGDGLL